jgi:membrane-bound ClpP family serine protease
MDINQDQEQINKIQLNKRIENTSWGVFLVMIGCLWLVPDRFIPNGTWLVGTGLILLGLNFFRYTRGIRMSGFTLFLGAIALLSGIADFFYVDLPLFPILLILIGANILIRPLIEKHPELES